MHIIDDDACSLLPTSRGRRIVRSSSCPEALSNHLQGLQYAIFFELCFCPFHPECAAQGMPPAWSWCKKVGIFCLASAQSCDRTSTCGDLVQSAKECKDAAVALLSPNATITVLNNKAAPAGCTVAQRKYTVNAQQMHRKCTVHSDALTTT